MLKPRETEKLSGWPRWKVWIIGLSAGIPLTLSQPPADWPLIGLFALAPLFVALPRTSPWGSWLMGFGVGLPYFMINTWWLGQMVTDPGNEWIIFAMFLFVTVVMCSFFGFAAFQMRWLLTRQALWPLALVPFVWLGWEFLHEFNSPAPFPWLPLGTSLADFTLYAQTADVWGQYGLSLSCAIVALCAAAQFKLQGPDAKFVRLGDRLHRYILPGAALGMLLIGCIYGMVRISQVSDREAGDGPLVGCVQGNLAQEVKVRNDPDRLPNSYRDHLALSEKAVQEDAELIVWAETMLFGGATREGLNRFTPRASARFFPDGIPSPALLDGTAFSGNAPYSVSYVEHLRAKVAHEFKRPMLVGVLTDIPPEEQIHEWKQHSYDRRKYNTAMLFDAQGAVADSYDKRYLVPGGEYIPHEGLEIFGWAPVRSLIEGYAEGLQGFASRVEPGLRTTTFRVPSQAERLRQRDWAFTTTICYEYAWPGCYVELHTRPERYPDFHLNISNEGWFKRSAELDQAVDFCRLRAIESRVPMLRATNTGITCNIDAAGRVREVLTVGGDDREVQGLLLTRPLVLSEPMPPMFVALLGRALGWLSLLIVLVVFSMKLASRVQERQRKRRILLARAQPAGPGAADGPSDSGAMT